MCATAGDTSFMLQLLKIYRILEMYLKPDFMPVLEFISYKIVLNRIFTLMGKTTIRALPLLFFSTLEYGKDKKRQHSNKADVCYDLHK